MLFNFYFATVLIFLNTLKKFILFYFFIFWPCHVACGILVPPPGIEPKSPALGALCLNHWTAREFPDLFNLSLFVLNQLPLCLVDEFQLIWQMSPNPTRWVAAEEGEERNVYLVSHILRWEGGEFSFFWNFCWNIVHIQCCVSFRCTAKWISYTYIHSFLDSFPK